GAGPPKDAAKSPGPPSATGTFGTPRSVRSNRPATEIGAAAIAGEAVPSVSTMLTPMLNAIACPCLSLPFGGGAAAGLLADHDDHGLGGPDRVEQHVDAEGALVDLGGRVVLGVALDGEDLLGRIRAERAAPPQAHQERGDDVGPD